VASFANGIAKDEAAVRAAITLPWSNGQTEGQITKLKLVKRQMYGRGHLDLLQARLIWSGVTGHDNCCTKTASEPNLDAD
jgi:transposase